MGITVGEISRRGSAPLTEGLLRSRCGRQECRPDVGVRRRRSKLSAVTHGGARAPSPESRNGSGGRSRMEERRFPPAPP